VVVVAAIHQNHLLAVWRHLPPVNNCDQAAVIGLVTTGVEIKDAARIDDVLQ
jgi:hypothetical protein